jgi:hypothetical protein
MVLQILLSLVVLGCLVTFVAWPLLRGVDEPEVDAARVELEIAKQAKYREIRDAELDEKAGKMTFDQWRETDAELRREALEIIRRMDELGKQADKSADEAKTAEPAG